MVKITKIAILWESFPDYLVKCIKVLAENHPVEILAACRSHDTMHSAKEDLLAIKNIKVIDFTEYVGIKERDGIKEVLDFHPDIAVITPKKFSILSEIALALKTNNIPVVGASDKYWHSSARDFANLMLSKTGYFRRLYDLFWVPGIRGRGYARKLGFKDSQIIEGLYSADVALFHKAYEHRLKKSEWPKVFLFVGQYIKRKNLSNLLKAYRLYRKTVKEPWELWCIGKGPLKTILQKQTGIRDLGPKNQVEISQTMAAAGCFILPSKIDHWGVVIHEAACAGLPILASTACGATDDLVRSGYNGFVFSANDVRGLSKLMQRISEREGIKNLGKNSYFQSLKNSPDLWAKKIMEEIPRALKIDQ